MQAKWLSFLLIVGIFGESLKAIDHLPRLLLPAPSNHLGVALTGTTISGDFFRQARYDLAHADNNNAFIDALLHVRYDAQRLGTPLLYADFIRDAIVIAFSIIVDETSHVLDTVAEHIRYWKYQQRHPIEHFFHKNPISWVENKQKADVADHISKLEAFKQASFETLGKAMQQIHALNNSGNVDSALQVLSEITGTTLSIKSIPSCDQQLEALISSCNQIPLYVKRLERTVFECAIPSFLERYGLSIAAGGVALAAYCKSVTDLHAWIDHKKETSEQTLETYKTDIRYKAVVYASNYGTLMGDLHTQLSKSIVGMQATRNKIASGFKRMKDWFKDGVVGKVGGALGIVSGAATSVIAGPSIGLAIGHSSDTALAEIDKTITAIDRNTLAIRQQLQNAYVQIPNIAVKVVTNVDRFAQHAKHVINWGAMLSKYGVVIGIPLTVWLSYRAVKAGYRTVSSIISPAPDYFYGQHSLIQIADILTTTMGVTGSMVPAQLGALVYHMHVISDLPVSDEYADQFKNDVAQLASESYTINQKLHVIDRMYRAYPFLNVREC